MRRKNFMIYNIVKKSAITWAVVSAFGTVALAENVFRFSFQGDIQGVDPMSHYESFQISTMSNVYEGLTRRDSTLAIKPHLATSWKVTIAPPSGNLHYEKG